MAGSDSLCAGCHILDSGSTAHPQQTATHAEVTSDALPSLGTAVELFSICLGGSLHTEA